MMHPRVGGHSRGQGAPPERFWGPSGEVGIIGVGGSGAIISAMRPNVIFPKWDITHEVEGHRRCEFEGNRGRSNVYGLTPL